MSWIVRILLIAGFTISASADSPGFAQNAARSAAAPNAELSLESRKNAARALFNEGLKLLDAQHWAAATDRFERARRLHASSRITYNLTTALMETGRLVYASQLLRELTSAHGVERSVKDAAEQRLLSLQNRIGTLTIVADVDLAGTTVELDGRSLDKASLNVAMTVDPGEHTLLARREGATFMSRMVSVQEGQSTTVHLAMPARLSSKVDSLPRITTPLPQSNALSLKEEETQPSAPPSLWLWASIGSTAVVGAVVAAVLLSRQNVDVIEGTAGTARLQGP